MTNKLFGTDGIRGVANTYPLTIDFCLKLGVILSNIICTNNKKVAIARDTRISGDMLFNSLCAGFTSQGVDVLDLGIIPTPLCTTLTPQLEVDMSIMITASHNPYHDNGLKLIASNGDKFSDEQSANIEKAVQQDFSIEYDKTKIGKVTKINAGLENYIKTINKFTSANSLNKMKIVIDSANGSFSNIMPEIFKYLGADIISLSDNPNGFNINQDCGSQHTENLCKTVTENHFDLGIAVDGDGDRIIICDEKGQRINGDQIIAYLATYFKQHNMLTGNSVVATMFSNLGLGKYITSLGLEYHTTAVGERYVIKKMKEKSSNVGGEESGHMVLSDYSLTGDALITAIIICLGIKENNKKVSEIFPIFSPFPAKTNNLRFENKEIMSKLMENLEIQNCIQDIQEKLKGHGSLIVRKSGTEPVIRIKIEDENIEIVEKLSEQIINCFNKIS